MVEENLKNTTLYQCWICFGEENIPSLRDSPRLSAYFNSTWVRPCKCRGSTEWVHQACLLNWIDLKLNQSESTNPSHSTSPTTTIATAALSPVLDASLPSSNYPSQPHSPSSPPHLSASSASSNNSNLPETPTYASIPTSGFSISPKVSCPQCHAEYRVTQSYLIPKHFVQLIEKFRACKNRLLLYSSLGLVIGSLYLVSWTYGASVVFVCIGSKDALDFFEQFILPVFNQFFTTSLVSNVHSTVPLPLAFSKVFFAIPLVPLYVLSSLFPSLAWLYPALPALLFTGPGSLSWSWPPRASTLILSLPFLHLSRQTVQSYLSSNVRNAFNRFSVYWNQERRSSIFSELAQEPSPILVRQSSVQNVMSDGDHVTENIPDEHGHYDATNLSDDDFDILEDDRSVKISILSTTATLLFPFAAAFAGYSLFGSTRLSGFQRTFIGGLTIIVVKDTFHYLYQLHSEYSRKTRRVLNAITNDS